MEYAGYDWCPRCGVKFEYGGPHLRVLSEVHQAPVASSQMSQGQCSECDGWVFVSFRILHEHYKRYVRERALAGSTIPPELKEALEPIVELIRRIVLVRVDSRDEHDVIIATDITELGDGSVPHGSAAKWRLGDLRRIVELVREDSPPESKDALKPILDSLGYVPHAGAPADVVPVQHYWQCDNCHEVDFVECETGCWRCHSGTMEYKEVVEQKDPYISKLSTIEKECEATTKSFIEEVAEPEKSSKLDGPPCPRCGCKRNAAIHSALCSQCTTLVACIREMREQYVDIEYPSVFSGDEMLDNWKRTVADILKVTKILSGTIMAPEIDATEIQGKSVCRPEHIVKRIAELKSIYGKDGSWYILQQLVGPGETAKYVKLGEHDLSLLLNDIHELLGYLEDKSAIANKPIVSNEDLMRLSNKYGPGGYNIPVEHCANVLMLIKEIGRLNQ